ncbi:Tenascin-R [Armadillidium vulgare]|nr:Tenascin-R [Armadillidium vulgare]
MFEGIGFSPSCVSKSLSICEEKKGTKSLLHNAEQDVLKILNETRNRNIEQKHPKNCIEIQKIGDTESGIKEIFPYRCCFEKSVNVFCEQDTDGGGWTVIQYRYDFAKRENFYRRWTEYKLGFGNLENEFWLGVDNIHALVSDSLMELRIDLEDYEGNIIRWANYSYFQISDESNKYKIDLGDYSGDAGDGLTYHLGNKFTTHDQDNDAWDENCARDTESGIKEIFPYRCCIEKSVNVFCDQETDGGGWTVIQYRYDFAKRENFYRRWTEYKLGFGNLESEFWLGLDNIHALVSDSLMELRIDLEDYEGNIRWAKYSYFHISDESNKV